MSSALPLVVSVGDPGGVGPAVSVSAAHALRARAPIVLFGDARQLLRLAEDSGIRSDFDVLSAASVAAAFGRVGVVDTGQVPEAVWRAHAPSPAAGEAQLRTLAEAAHRVMHGGARALVTGPTSKAAIVLAGHPFVGQTEYLARADGRDDDAVSMLFLGPKLRVGLVTTHLSVRAVPDAITAARVVRTTRHVAEALVRLTPGKQCTLAVVGLNPHAGEGGLFGREELDVVGGALAGVGAALQAMGVRLTGPLPAESVFRAAQRGDIDGVVAMYHDQATIAAKLLDWGASVNTTWGLSFLRTSVDHGVAYDAARAGTAEDDGMRAALEMALRLTDTKVHG